jgi:ribokinase
MRPRLLFAGDANVDLILSGLASPPQEDREVFCEGYAAALGGSTTIAAAAYARLGGRADFCGMVGDDANGRLARRALSEAGVGLGLLRMNRGATTGVTVNLSRASTRTQVTYRGSLSEVDESETILRSLGRYSHLHISGPYGTPAFLPRIEGVLKAAKESRLTSSLDTQWDPSERWEGAEKWLPLLTYLFVNEAEADSLARRLGGETARDAAREAGGDEAAWEPLARSTACPIIKLGPRGVFASGTLHPPFSVEVVDPTGAGDAFAAAFLFATLERGLGFEEALRFAQAAGALACTFIGGSSSAFSAAGVEEILG